MCVRIASRHSAGQETPLVTWARSGLPLPSTVQVRGTENSMQKERNKQKERKMGEKIRENLNISTRSGFVFK